MKTNIKQLFAFVMKFTFAFLILFIATVTYAMAQTTGTTIDANTIKSYFGDMGLLASATLLVCVFIRAQGLKGFAMQYLSWVIAMALAILGYFMQWGMFVHIGIGWTIGAGLGAGLIANGIADTQLVQAIYNALKDR